MKRQISKQTALAAPAGPVAGMTGRQSKSSCEDGSDCTQKHPAVLVPDFNLDDQVGILSNRVMFGVKGKFPSAMKHRWFFNGAPIGAKSARKLGVTGYNGQNLTILKAKRINCGFYTYQNELLLKDGRIAQKISATAQLWIARPAAAIGALQTVVTVYGTVTAAPGTSGGCPGRYVGYARYPATYFRNGGLACDGKNADNAVVFYGTPFTNTGCGVNCVNVPATSCNYTFCIFFKTMPPAGAYPLNLTIY